MRKVAPGPPTKSNCFDFACPRKQRPMQVLVEIVKLPVFFVKFSLRQICERHLLEANLPSSIWMGEGSCMLQPHCTKPYVEWPFWCEFQPDRNCTVPSISFQSIVLCCFFAIQQDDNAPYRFFLKSSRVFSSTGNKTTNIRQVGGATKSWWDMATAPRGGGGAIP